MKKVILICVLTAVAVFSLVGVALSKQGEDQLAVSRALLMN